MSYTACPSTFRACTPPSWPSIEAPRAGAKFDYADAAPHLVERARRLAAGCARRDVPLRAAALRFSYAHPAVTSVLVGCRSAEEVAGNVRAHRHPVPAQMWSDLVADGILPADVPLPVEAR